MGTLSPKGPTSRIPGDQRGSGADVWRRGMYDQDKSQKVELKMVSVTWTFLEDICLNCFHFFVPIEPSALPSTI